MGRRLAVGVGVAAGTALLVAGVGSAGLVGLRGTPPGVVVTSTPTTEEPSARPIRPTPSPPPADPVPAEVLLAQQLLDPDAVPVRTVDRAAAVVEVLAPTSGSIMFAFDADTAQWVRLELPGGSTSLSLRLSPDGRTVLSQQFTPETLVTLEVVDLPTGAARPVPVPVPAGRVAGDCWADDAAWASNGRIGVVSGCLVPNPAPGPGYAYVGSDTWVHEVDLATGGARVVEHVQESAPLENNLAYSPDGRFLVYGIGYGPLEGEDEEWETLRVTQVDGSGAREQPMTHIAPGDPWADGRTVLAWDWEAAMTDASGYHVLVDARTGGATPLGIEGLLNAHGFVGGRLVAQDGPWAPGTAQITLAVVDLDTGEVQPWLAVPDGFELGEVSVAREVVAP